MSKYIWGDSETQFFFHLNPEAVLNAVDFLGLRTTGRVLTLNSMEKVISLCCPSMTSNSDALISSLLKTIGPIKKFDFFVVFIFTLVIGGQVISKQIPNTKFQNLKRLEFEILRLDIV